MISLWPRFNPRYGAQEVAAAFQFGSAIARFEERFAVEMEQKYALFFPYGRTALIAILKSLGLQDQEIICPAYTCVVVPHAIVFSGNIPVFVDSSANDYNMNWNEVEKQITPQTGAIIATSIFGYPVDLDQLESIKVRYPAIAIIQDCAHSFHCHWQGRAVNRKGIAAFYGMNISKITNSVFGGMVTTDNEDFYNKLATERAQMLRPKTFRQEIYIRAYFFLVWICFHPIPYWLIHRLVKLRMFQFLIKYYDESQIDMPEDYKMAPTQFAARIGLAQVSRYSQFIKIRKECAEYYDQALADIDQIERPPLVEGATYSHYVPQVENKAELLHYCESRGVEIGEIIEYSIPAMKSYANQRGDRQFPWTDRWPGKTINLPVYSRKIAEKTVRILREFYAQ